MFESLESRRLLSVSVMFQGNTLVVQGDDGPNNIRIEQESLTEFSIFQDGAFSEWCSTNPIFTVKLYGGDGCDVLNFGPSIGRFGLTKGFIFGGGGDDQIVLESICSRDTVDGDGPDYFYDDEETCDPGCEDWVDYAFYEEPVNVSLDNVANDGYSGEKDNILESVENIQGTDYCDYLIGSCYPNTIQGLCGDDVIYGQGDCDLLYGDDGNDSIRGGSGDDNIIGGEGCDSMFGDADNDTLWANDREYDIVIGGKGKDDLAFVDPFDNFSSDVETIILN